MSQQLQGTPVGNMDAVWDGEPGSYFAKKNDEGQITGLWFKMPTGGIRHINSTAVGKDPAREWTITEDKNGIVTVDPSIENHGMPGRTEPEWGYWHGHLRNGVWEW